MNAVATLAPEGRASKSLVVRMGERFGVDPDKLLTTLKATAFRQKEGTVITNEQMMGLLVVADQYDLNPFTKEIYAFEDRGAIVPIVSVDGWSRIINSHPELDGIEFVYADKLAELPGAKPCPEWCEVHIYRKDRARPIVVREYLDEVYRPPFKGRKSGGGEYTVNGPWQTHTKRFLRHKTLIQGSRIAFGFAGIFDEDEGKRIIEGHATVVNTAQERGLSDLELQLIARGKSEQADVIDAEHTEAKAEDAPDAEEDAAKQAADEPGKAIRSRMLLAADTDALDEAYDLVRTLDAPEAVLDELKALYENRRDVLAEA